jgi:uncharacterized membrane protein
MNSSNLVQNNPGKQRIESIDLLRGLVMIIMALDHTRDFFHRDGLTGNPLDPATTTPILYFTRWITHLCAPTFVFLSGLSAWLQHRRKSTAELSRFLISRGLWLILLEVTVITLGITADIHFGVFVLQTIWSIGISMVILGLLIWLPFPVLLSIGVLIVVGHNLLDYAEAAREGKVPVWWSFLHRPTFIPLTAKHGILLFYPFLSWAGLMILGYCCGKIFTTTGIEQRKKILLSMGAGALVFFILLRLTNSYGNPGSWSKQASPLQTFYSFMDVQKYPPSLLFICATIGCSLIFLGLCKNAKGKFAEVIKVYGRVPFFYYILHFYLLQTINIIDYLGRGHSVAEGMKGVPNIPFKFEVIGEGYNLFTVYAIWLAVVIALYPLCRWYDRYKMAHKEKWWLSYL